MWIWNQWRILIISVFNFSYRRFTAKFKTTLKSDVANKDYLTIKILHQPFFLINNQLPFWGTCNRNLSAKANVFSFSVISLSWTGHYSSYLTPYSSIRVSMLNDKWSINFLVETKRKWSNNEWFIKEAMITSDKSEYFFH